MLETVTAVTTLGILAPWFIIQIYWTFASLSRLTRIANEIEKARLVTESRRG